MLFLAHQYTPQPSFTCAERRKYNRQITIKLKSSTYHVNLFNNFLPINTPHFFALQGMRLMKTEPLTGHIIRRCRFMKF